MLFAFFFSSLFILNSVYGQPTPEQLELGGDEDSKTKSYSDCKGFADMMESSGVPKEQIGLNYDWVKARMLAMPNLISFTSNETDKEKLQEEYDCLLAVRAANTTPDTSKFCEELRGGTAGEVTCMFDDELSTAESVPSSVSPESEQREDNWMEYTNSDLGISFEYPSTWTFTIKLTDKPFGDDRASIEVKGPDGYEAGSWYDWASIKTGASTASVSVYMSESDFPSGEQYQACVSSKPLFNFVPNWARGIHGSGDETIRMSLE